MFGTGQTEHVRTNGNLHGPISEMSLGRFHSRFSYCLIKSNLVFLTSPFFQPSKSNFCSSENSMLLPCCAASRLSKRLTADPLKKHMHQSIWKVFNFCSELFVLQPLDWRREDFFGCIILLDIICHTEKNCRLHHRSCNKYIDRLLSWLVSNRLYLDIKILHCKPEVKWRTISCKELEEFCW